jgi:P-type Ca2+ transporter type 2C
VKQKKNDAPHRLKAEEVFSRFDSKEEGITGEQAAERLKKYGANIIEGKKQSSLLRLLLDQLNNPIIYLLVGATAVSFSFGDIPEAIAIIVVIILNTAIGFWMEYQARISIKALKKLNRLKTQVIRDNETRKTDASKIVPGDVIDLDVGDVIPADARIFFASDLKVDESPLTGESLPVDKHSKPLEEDVELAERSNMLYKGTALTNGKARAIVISTGKQTEIGKISEMAEQEDKDSIPLNAKLRKLSHNLIWVTAGLAAAFFITGWLTGEEIYPMLQTAIAWTVAAIPEGLPIVASIALARGMLRLAKRNVIVRKLAAVETLGETTVIFTDKTGTLTENKLTLEAFEFPGSKTDAAELLKNKKSRKKEKKQTDNENFQHILKVIAFCNDAEPKEKGKTEGDPLDVSLYEFFNEYDSEYAKELRNSELVTEDPFDSETKFMGTVHAQNEGLYISGKGAAEEILSRCDHYLEKGEKKRMTSSFKKEWLKKNEELSEKGFKVIACAYKTVEESERESLKEKEDFIHKMVFCGFLSFVDPAKKEVKHAIEKCKAAGIQVIMVTGDHPGTAKNVARKVNLHQTDELEIMKGSEIEKKEDDIYSSDLFARVDPGQKYQIVKRFREEGEITAMTGDGVNDAPALKAADIGIAMGHRGTQIAREVADMVLKDDAFSSIVQAIEEGRIIFENIRKFIVYQLSYHFAEILIIAGISFSLFNLPLLALQLLFLNMVSDVFPALALGLGKGDAHIMKRGPKDPDEPIINKQNWMAMGIYGIIMAVIISGVYLLVIFRFDDSKEVANTVTFFSLATTQLLHVFNMRDPHESVFMNQVVKNRYIWMALALCFFLLAAAYFVPFLHDALSFEKLSAGYWLLIGAASIFTTIVIQTVKSIFKI